MSRQDALKSLSKKTGSCGESAKIEIFGSSESIHGGKRARLLPDHRAHCPITAAGMNTKSQGNSNMNNQKSSSKMETNTLPPHAKGSGLRTAGGIVLIVSLLFCVWLMGGAVAYNWLAHDYGSTIRFFGKCFFFLAGVMTAGVILYFCRLDLPALILDAASYIPIRFFLLIAMQKAEENGWSGQTEASFGVQAAEKWHSGMMWTALPFLLLFVLALTR